MISKVQWLCFSPSFKSMGYYGKYVVLGKSHDRTFFIDHGSVLARSQDHQTLQIRWQRRESAAYLCGKQLFMAIMPAWNTQSCLIINFEDENLYGHFTLVKAPPYLPLASCATGALIILLCVVKLRWQCRISLGTFLSHCTPLTKNITWWHCCLIMTT